VVKIRRLITKHSEQEVADTDKDNSRRNGGYFGARSFLARKSVSLYGSCSFTHCEFHIKINNLTKLKRMGL